MSVVQIRFYAELNDFLPAERRGRTLERRLTSSPSVKDLIESYGVPHTEVDLIVVNGESVGFDYRVTGGDYVSVYPVFEALDIGATTRLRSKPLRDPRFVLDVHLGTLARYLRMLGFDALYSAHADDDELARISHEQHRILLTRDRGLLMRGIVTHGHYVRNTSARRQLAEVVQHFHLVRLAKPFSRCMKCNGLLREVAKEEVVDRLPPRVRREHQQFQICGDCGQVYWKGSHHERMRRLIDAVLESVELP